MHVVDLSIIVATYTFWVGSVVKGLDLSVVRRDGKANNLNIPNVSTFSAHDNQEMKNAVIRVKSESIDITHGYAGESIKGIPLIRATSESKALEGNPIAWNQALANVSIFSNYTLMSSVSNGTLKSIPFTQKDIDLLNSVPITPMSVYYSEVPVGSQLPILFSEPEFDVKGGWFGNSVRTQSTSASQGTSSMNKTTAAYSSNFAVSHDVSAPATLLSVPTMDPFYHPALSSYQGAKVGTPITYRSVGFNIGFYPVGTRSYQIQYRSENTQGNDPRADVTTLFIPPNNPNPGFVVTVLLHEDAVNLACSTSYTLVGGTQDAHLQAFLRRGWAANVPDYQGVNSAFLASILNSKATLDSMRAAVALAPTLNTQVARFAIYGYSAGALVAGFTLTQVEQYAPEFAPGGRTPIIGAGIGGFVNDLSSTLTRVSSGYWKGMVVMGTAGLATEYPDAHALLLASLSSPLFFGAYLGCAPLEVLMYFLTPISSIFKGGIAALKNPILAAVMNENSVKGNAINVPIFIQQSSFDEVVDVGTVDKIVNQWCNAGLSIWYYRDPLPFVHLAEELVAIESMPAFFDGVLTGKFNTKNHLCSSYFQALSLLPNLMP